MLRICILIPARYNSVRFPGKLLYTLGENSIIQHVYKNCLKCNQVTKVIVAVEHQKLVEHCKTHDIEYVMTSTDHLSGTDRIAEADRILNENFDLIINTQGDEPMITEVHINKLIELMTETNAEIGTLFHEIPYSINNNVNQVKLVTNNKKQVMYFSRNTIPVLRDNDNELLKLKKHMGIYAYKPHILQEITQLKPTSLEKAEKLEQLRWLENNYTIYADQVEYNGIGIDTEADLLAARLKLGLT